MLNAASPSRSSDNNQWALAKSQFASPLVPIEIWGATRRGWPPRPGTVPSRGSSELPQTSLLARRRAARGGLQFPECPAATGGAPERPQPIRGSAGAAGERQVEPGRGAGAGPGPRRRPGARGLGVGRGASRAGTQVESSRTGPSRGGVRGRPSGSGCSRRAQPRAHLTGIGLRGKAGLGRTPQRRGVLQPLLLAAVRATARAGPTSPPALALSHGFRQFPPHPAPVYLREEKVPRI